MCVVLGCETTWCVALIILQFIPFIYVPAPLSLVASAPYLFLYYPLVCDGYLLKFSLLHLLFPL